MSSRNQQKRETERALLSGRAYFGRELGTWTRGVVATWIPGSDVVPEDAQIELAVIMRRGYDVVANGLLHTDWRIYKQQDEPSIYDDVLTAIAAVLGPAFADRVRASSTAIVSTLRTMMSRANAAAVEAETARSRDRIARIDLARRMQRHRITIAVTETNWSINVTRNTTVLLVADPLENSIEQIAGLIEAGDNNAARRVAREVSRLARLPLSVSEGKAVGYISDARDRLVTPGAQARIVAGMRERGRAMESQEKAWSALFHNTRPSHAAADGQTQPVDAPFVLEGGRLQYPMDGSLGAPLSEIINCQCEVYYL